MSSDASSLLSSSQAGVELSKKRRYLKVIIGVLLPDWLTSSVRLPVGPPPRLSLI